MALSRFRSGDHCQAPLRCALAKDTMWSISSSPGMVTIVPVYGANHWPEATRQRRSER